MTEQNGGGTFVCIDFDGTLVDGEGRIHPTDVDILENDRSVEFVPATGRPLHSVRRTLERHGLFVDEPIPFPLVLENGSAVYLENEVLLSQRSFEAELQEELMDAVWSSSEASFMLFSLDAARLLHVNDRVRGFVRRFDLDERHFDPEEGLPQPLCKIAVTADEPKILRDFQATLSGMPLEHTYSLPDMLEISPVGVHKGLGLNDLLENAGTIDPNVFVVGDGENDLALFDRADLSFTPSDSPRNIQAHADRVLDLEREGLLTPILREIRSRAA